MSQDTSDYRAKKNLFFIAVDGDIVSSTNPFPVYDQDVAAEAVTTNALLLEIMISNRSLDKIYNELKKQTELLIKIYN